MAIRPGIDSIAQRYHASAKVAEIPPGPPVLSTLVAEVYAANDSTRLAAASEVKRVFETTPGVVDIDWTVEAPQSTRTFRVDRVRAGEEDPPCRDCGGTGELVPVIEIPRRKARSPAL